jgi:hypothetical protein
MALSIASREVQSVGNRRAILVTVAGTNAAGGLAITPKSFGLHKIDAVLPEVGEAGKELVYDRVAGKLSLFDGGTEDTSTDTTGKGIRALVVGY